MESKKQHYLKIALLIFYLLCLGGLYLYLAMNDASFTDILYASKRWIIEAGPLGWLVILAVYAISTFVPFPTTSIAVLSGIIYGPLIGITLAVIGVNMTAWMSFYLARFFGRHFVEEKERGWVKELDALISEKGFIPVMLARLLMLPSDFVSLGSGLTNMPFKRFAKATFFGTFPITVLFAYFGNAVLDTAGRLAIILLVLVIAGLLFLARSIPWVKAHLPK